MRDWLVRLGLIFEDPIEERRFAERYLLRTVRESQLFLVVSALLVYVFFFGDKLMDPANADTAHKIRGMFVVPIVVGIAGLLSTGFGRRHFEAFVLSALMVVQIGIAWIYGVLGHGYQFSALAFTMALLGTTAMFPLRSRFLVLASPMSMIVVVVGHILADNAPAGWLFYNAMAIFGSTCMGTLAAYIRERGARFAFRTQEQLDAARIEVDDLLHSMLPREIVTRIRAGETMIADSHGEVTIVFADLVGFTELSRRISASQLVKVLNNLFSAFDMEAERLGIERIKTIGDAYMAIGGLVRVEGAPDHAECAAHFAFAMQDAVRRLKEERGYPIDVRIGLHVGPVVAGVIGVKRPAYDCWGEGVNLASRLESAATPGSILVSESAYWRLRPAFELEAVPDIELKGIGIAKVYRLMAVRAERKSDLITILQLGPATAAAT
jgi:class 3 adenylate cyclase